MTTHNSIFNFFIIFGFLMFSGQSLLEVEHQNDSSMMGIAGLLFLIIMQNALENYRKEKRYLTDGSAK